MSTAARLPARDPAMPPDLDALEAVSAAVETGAGLPEVVRAAARALGASLVLLDPTGSVLAVAARSPADERSLVAAEAGVETVELRVAEEVVARLRARWLRGTPPAAVLALVKTLVAAEVQRVRGPERASQEASAGFVRDVLARRLASAEGIVAAARELGLDLEGGASAVVVRAHPMRPTEDDWRARVLAVAERGARAVAPGALAVIAEWPDGRRDEVLIIVPAGADNLGARVAETVRRELEAQLQGFTFAVGRSRPAADPAELHRSAHEALLAANVAEGEGEGGRVLAFEETGAYRLLLPAMSDDPEELQRFFAETVEPLVAYDDQYETDLVQTLETFLDCDGNVAGTAQRLYTHRHTVRYRLERIRELCGLDVGSSDGREKLSLGLKAMRVLGIAARPGPATERGAEGGRVPGRRGRGGS